MPIPGLPVAHNFTRLRCAMPTVTIEQAFQTALAHHQAGRLAEAEALYRQILSVQPGHADALYFLVSYWLSSDNTRKRLAAFSVSLS